MDLGFASSLSSASVQKTPLTLGKWGQSLVSNSRRNAPQPTLTKYSFDPRISQERYMQLKEAFYQIDSDRSGFISLKEILEFLHRFSDELDEEYISTIFQSIDRNHDNQLSIDEFIEGYLEQVNGLTEALSEMRNEQAEKMKHRERIMKELEENLQREKENSYGIMEGSQLVVTVVEAQNLNLGAGKPNPYVELKCESQRIRTAAVSGNRNPSWEETFTFNIKVGGGELLCSIYSRSSTTEDELIGSCTIPLKDLEDQIKQERWYSVSSKVTTGARLLLACHWIHHKCEYLQRQIQEWDQDIEANIADVTRLESELRKLGTSPMGMFIKDNWLTVWERRLIVAIDEFTDRHLSSFSQWEAARQVLIAVVTVICIFACFSRPDFFNLAITSFCVMQEIIGWKQVTLRATIACLVVGFVSDMLWLFVNSSYLISEDDRMDSQIQRFSYVMSLLNYVMKLFLLTAIVKAYIKAQEEPLSGGVKSKHQYSISVSQVP